MLSLLAGLAAMARGDPSSRPPHIVSRHPSHHGCHGVKKKRKKKWCERSGQLQCAAVLGSLSHKQNRVHSKALDVRPVRVPSVVLTSPPARGPLLPLVL